MGGRAKLAVQTSSTTREVSVDKSHLEVLHHVRNHDRRRATDTDTLHRQFHCALHTAPRCQA
jgi:hypothetical protein